MLLCLAVSAAYLTSPPGSFLSAPVGLLCACSVVGRWRSYDLQDLLNIAAFYTATRLLESFSALQLWQAVLVLSPLQLLRRPAALKSALRPARVAAGPVSTWLALQALGSCIVCLLMNTRYRAGWLGGPGQRP